MTHDELLAEGDRLYAEEKAKGHIFFRGLRLDVWPALSSALREAGESFVDVGEHKPMPFPEADVAELVRRVREGRRETLTTGTFLVLADECERLAGENARLIGILRKIAEYEPSEICYDEFAYSRMVESYRKAARAALTPEPEKR